MIAYCFNYYFYLFYWNYCLWVQSAFYICDIVKDDLFIFAKWLF